MKKCLSMCWLILVLCANFGAAQVVSREESHAYMLKVVAEYRILRQWYLKLDHLQRSISPEVDSSVSSRWRAQLDQAKNYIENFGTNLDTLVRNGNLVAVGQRLDNIFAPLNTVSTQILATNCAGCIGVPGGLIGVVGSGLDAVGVSHRFALIRELRLKIIELSHTARRQMPEVPIRIVEVPIAQEEEMAPEVTPEPAPAPARNMSRNRPRTRVRTVSNRLSERERRMQELREEYEQRRQEEEQPANLTNQRELRRQMQRAVNYSRRHEGELPRNFNWAMVRAEADAHDIEPQVNRAQWKSANERWNRSMDHYREIARSRATGETDVTRTSRAIHDLVSEYLVYYKESEATAIGPFLGRGGNCQTRTHLMVSVLSQVPELVPEGFRLGVQVYRDHVQAVLIPTDLNDHRVWDLMSGRMITRREAPIYAPAVAVNSYLTSNGVNTRVNSERFLIAPRDPKTREELEQEVTANQHDPMQSSQNWAESDATHDPSGQNPAESWSTPPSANGPTDASASEGVGENQLGERAPGQGSGQSGMPQMPASMMTLERNLVDYATTELRDPRLAQIVSESTGDRELAREKMSRYLAETLTAIDQGQAPGEDRSRYADNIYALLRICSMARRLGQDCASNPMQRVQIERYLNESNPRLSDPAFVLSELMATEEHANAILEEYDYLKMVIHSRRRLSEEELPPRLRHLSGISDEDAATRARELSSLMRQTEHVSIYEVTNQALLNGQMNGNPTGMNVLTDGAPLSDMMDYLMDSRNVVPHSDEDDYQAEAGNPSLVVEGNTSSPTLRQARPAHARQEMLEEELNAPYEISGEQYAYLAESYAIMRSGQLTRKIEVLARAMAIRSRRNEREISPQNLASAQFVQVCGGEYTLSRNQVKDALTRAALLDMSSAPGFPCPGMSASARESEFTRLSQLVQ